MRSRSIRRAAATLVLLACACVTPDEGENGPSTTDGEIATADRVFLADSVIAEIAGRYEIEGLPEFEITFQPGSDGTLEVVVPGQGTMVFYPTSADEWFDVSDGDVMMIERDSVGRTVGAVNDGTTKMIRRP